jgi:hypothetical protein
MIFFGTINDCDIFRMINSCDLFASSRFVNSHEWLFDFFKLLVNEMMSTHHASLPMDGPDDFITCLVHLPLDPTSVGPHARSDDSDPFSSCTHFLLSGRGFRWSRSFPLQLIYDHCALPPELPPSSILRRFLKVQRLNFRFSCESNSWISL